MYVRIYSFAKQTRSLNTIGYDPYVTRVIFCKYAQLKMLRSHSIFFIRMGFLMMYKSLVYQVLNNIFWPYRNMTSSMTSLKCSGKRVCRRKQGLDFFGRSWHLRDAEKPYLTKRAKKGSPLYRAMLTGLDELPQE